MRLRRSTRDLDSPRQLPPGRRFLDFSFTGLKTAVRRLGEARLPGVPGDGPPSRMPVDAGP